MRDLINDEAMRDELADNLYRDVQQYHIAEVNKMRIEIYEKIL